MPQNLKPPGISTPQHDAHISKLRPVRGHARVGGEVNSGRDGGHWPRRTVFVYVRRAMQSLQVRPAYTALRQTAGRRPQLDSKSVQLERRTPAKYPRTNEATKTIWTLPNSSCQPMIWRPKTRSPTKRAIAAMFTMLSHDKIRP